MSFLSPVSLLFLRSRTTRDRIWGSRALEILGHGQDDTALKVLGILDHPIPLIILWTLLVGFPGGWCYCGTRALFLRLLSKRYWTRHGSCFPGLLCWGHWERWAIGPVGTAWRGTFDFMIG